MSDPKARATSGGYLTPHNKSNILIIIFLSALSGVEDIVKAFQVGGVDYITKPFRSEEVLARVRTHLALQNAIREKDAAHGMLQTILNSIENGIVTVDNDLRVINCNRAAQAICTGPDHQPAVRRISWR
jgi:DNA-binding response OmpR family regulator